MTVKKLRILLVESSDEDAEKTLSKLTTAGYLLEHKRVPDAAGMQAALENASFDVILCNDGLSGFGGLPALKLMHHLEIDIPFILLAHEINEQTIIHTMQEGADDYILKGSLNRLVPSIEHNLREARLRHEHRAAQLALLENQTRMHAFIADLPGMAYQVLLHNSGQISFPYVSEGCHALLGLEPQELIGDEYLFDALLHPEDASSYVNSMQLSAKQLSFWNWEGRIHTQPNNEIKWINLRCSPRRTKDGVQWEGIMLNITQSKRAEADLKLSKQQLRELSSQRRQEQEL
ncbi:MAG: PAS domain-containing protein, partial [Pseudomonadota bacterium]